MWCGGRFGAVKLKVKDQGYLGCAGVWRMVRSDRPWGERGWGLRHLMFGALEQEHIAVWEGVRWFATRGPTVDDT